MRQIGRNPALGSRDPRIQAISQPSSPPRPKFSGLRKRFRPSPYGAVAPRRSGSLSKPGARISIEGRLLHTLGDRGVGRPKNWVSLSAAESVDGDAGPCACATSCAPFPATRSIDRILLICLRSFVRPSWRACPGVRAIGVEMRRGAGNGVVG